LNAEITRLEYQINPYDRIEIIAFFTLVISGLIFPDFYAKYEIPGLLIIMAIYMCWLLFRVDREERGRESWNKIYH